MLAEAHAGNLRGMYVVGENPALSEPDIQHAAEALEDMEFLVVQDIFMTETADYADVVLPAATSPEKHGTFTNTERRIQRVRPTSEPPGEARQDWEITQALARRLGYDWDYDHPREVMDEINSLAPIYGGVTYDRLESGEEHGLQWPCWDEGHEGTPYLYDYEDGNFNFEDGKARFVPADGGHPGEIPDEEYPLTLTSGRVLYHWHTGQITRRVEGLMSHVGESFVEVHPETARSSASPTASTSASSPGGAISSSRHRSPTASARGRCSSRCTSQLARSTSLPARRSTRPPASPSTKCRASAWKSWDRKRTKRCSGRQTPVGNRSGSEGRATTEPGRPLPANTWNHELSHKIHQHILHIQPYLIII